MAKWALTEADLLPLHQTRSLVLNTELKGDTSDLYKSAKAGDLLLGKLNLGPAASKAYCDLTYLIPPEIKKDEDKDEEKETPALIDLQLPIIEKIKDDKEKRAFIDELLVKNPKHLPLLMASLKALKDDVELEDVTKAADRILAEIDEQALAAYLGRKPLPIDEQTADDKKTKKEMDVKRSAWTLAYSRKLQASQKGNMTAEDSSEFFLKYRAFLESPEKDADYGLISARRDIGMQVSDSFPIHAGGRY